MSLKMSCMRSCDNDIARAKELYDFLASDIPGLPDVDPVRPGTFEQVMNGATEVLGWINEHKDDFAQGLALIQSMRAQASAASSATSIPPIPEP